LIISILTDIPRTIPAGSRTAAPLPLDHDASGPPRPIGNESRRPRSILVLELDRRNLPRRAPHQDRPDRATESTFSGLMPRQAHPGPVGRRRRLDSHARTR
jgi:hypothetical protein